MYGRPVLFVSCIHSSLAGESVRTGFATVVFAAQCRDMITAALGECGEQTSDLTSEKLPVI